MDTQSVEQLNTKKIDLLKSYSWICNTFSDALKSAILEFWEMDIDFKLLNVSEEQGFFFAGSEYFVTRIKLDEGNQFVVRISKEAVQVLLDMALGFNPDFEFEKITGLEAKVLTEFNNFIHEKCTGFIKPNSNESTGDIYLTFMAKDLADNPAKIIITIPKSYLDFEEIIPAGERFSIGDFPKAKAVVDFHIGSTTLPLTDVKNIEKEDIIVLENSNINNMTLVYGEEIGFSVSPDPSLIVSFDEDNEDKNMSKSKNIWDNIQVDISAEFEKVKISLGEIKQISEGLVVDMGSLYENKVFLKVENKTIAEGELVIVNDRYGVKIDKVLGENQISSENIEDTASQQEPQEEVISSEEEPAEDSQETDGENEEFDYKDFDVDDENI